MLKAKISQTKSNLYAVKTTKYDTADIELTVETIDSSPWLNPKFELLGIKSDGHEVRQTENFNVVDLNNHIVQVTLDEQFVTCDGDVDLQLLIKDGSRKSSTPFKLFVGRSLDSDILESHRNVKVLDELETYIIEGRKYISEATELAKSTANHVQTVNTQAEANEAQRMQNESQRQSAETKRNEAEDERKQAEVLRVQNEDTRQSAEVIRIANEQTRLENESNRIERETARENKESIRQIQEQKRHTSESTRQSQEATRQSQEATRQSNEDNRNQEEATRINNEATRKHEEDTRKSQELDRQSVESARRTSETNRNNAESTRTQNENTRKSQETTRQQKETERQSAEATRQQKEVERQSEETKRLEAEELRKEAYIEARQLLDELQDFEPITEKDRTDYMGNLHQTLKAKNDADVDWLLGEINTAHYDGQHITATDTIEGRSKSAILKGNTLVNLLSDDKFEGSATIRGWDFALSYPLTTNKTYLLIVNVTKDDTDYGWNCRFTDGTNYPIYQTDIKGTGIKKIKFTPSIELTKFSPYFRLEDWNNGKYVTLENMMVLEYQDGMENWDIPYFEGMQSVKMPVLTTTGKNLFDIEKVADINNWVLDKTTAERPYGYYEFSLKPNTTYTFSRKSNVRADEIYACFHTVYGVYSEHGGIIHPTNDKVNRTTVSFTTDSNGKIFLNGYGLRSNFSTFISLIEEAQIEEGSVATPYEPYKTNILTVNEPVELRAIDNVKDELNLSTGELTQRIGEIMLDGSEGWSYNTSNFTAISKSQIVKIDNTVDDMKTDVICDKLPSTKTGDGIRYYSKSGLIYITKQFSNSQEFLEWLSIEKPVIQYQLPEKSIKTVDLSDNHVYSYKDVTHYNCSSAEGSLVPTLSIDVPTNLSALVSRQRETISAQENQIKLLEETNSELIISQETQNEEIITNMLASVELFEMVLAMAPLSIDMSKSMEVNPMVEVYVTLILKGEKTIEQVPAVIRDKVQAQLDLLTK